MTKLIVKTNDGKYFKITNESFFEDSNMFKLYSKIDPK